MIINNLNKMDMTTFNMYIMNRHKQSIQALMLIAIFTICMLAFGGY